MDGNLNLLPTGLPGELYVSGAGLARGYLFQEALTNERFIDNPFEEGTKLYKTGDLVRFLEDGSMVYVGRTDEQVKVRGFRIELGEIEHALLDIAEVKESMVLVKEDQNKNAFLMAYVTSHDNVELNFTEVKAALGKQLPEYMLPTSMIQLEKMPVTANGKVDKKALAKLDVNLEANTEYVAPRNETEETLARLFAQI